MSQRHIVGVPNSCTTTTLARQYKTATLHYQITFENFLIVDSNLNLKTHFFRRCFP